MSRTRFAPALLLALSACTAPEKDTAQPADTSVEEPEVTLDPVNVVVLITIDSVTERLYGTYEGWSVTPNLDALFADSVVLPDTYTVRGYTKVALTAMHTGQYPRTTGVRTNDDVIESDDVDLFKILHDQGWATAAMSSNMCTVFDYDPDAIDVNLCTAAAGAEGAPQHDLDQEVTDGILRVIGERDPAQPLFVRMHLSDPHWPYNKIEPYFSEFYPDPWTGWDPSDPEATDARMLSDEPISDDERRYLLALYASQLRGADAMVGQVLDLLKAEGLYDSSLIVYGSDHGDELGFRSNYLYHGCSFYDTVMRARYSFRAPGLEPGTIEGPISLVNFAPTILEIAGAPLPSGLEGHSLVSELVRKEHPGLPVYFERSVGTVGMVRDDLKVVLNPEGAYDACTPYSASSAETYPGEPVEVYDLASDPDELVNLAGEGLPPAESMLDDLCQWVVERPWLGGNADDASSVLVQGCRTRLQ